MTTIPTNSNTASASTIRDERRIYAPMRFEIMADMSLHFLYGISAILQGLRYTVNLNQHIRVSRIGRMASHIQPK